MPIAPLSDADITAKLAELEGWQLTEGKLARQFAFDDFVAAFGWMTQVALVAEKLDHHPDWTNVYNRVSVRLWTHDANGITGRDFELAAAMDRLAR